MGHSGGRDGEAAPDHRRPSTAAALAAITIAVIVLAQESNPAQASAPAGAPPPAPVSVATVTESDIAAWEEFSGRLEAVERVDIRSRVAGVVQATHFREGALVAKGDLLVSIDPAPYEAEVARAEAQTVAAQARVTHASNEHARARRLWDDKAIAQRELDDRENALREAEANLKAAQAQLQSSRLSLGYTQVRAPVAGRIGRLEVTVGNLIAAGPGAPVLTTLVSVSPIYASFDADEKTVTGALKSLAGGARRTIERIPVQMGTSATSDTPYTGQLQLIDNQVDPRSGTVRVRAVFDNKDGSLMPGQFARIRMGQPQTARTLLVYPPNSQVTEYYLLNPVTLTLVEMFMRRKEYCDGLDKADLARPTRLRKAIGSAGVSEMSNMCSKLYTRLRQALMA